MTRRRAIAGTSWCAGRCSQQDGASSWTRARGLAKALRLRRGVGHRSRAGRRMPHSARDRRCRPGRPRAAAERADAAAAAGPVAAGATAAAASPTGADAAADPASAWAPGPSPAAAAARAAAGAARRRRPSGCSAGRRDRTCRRSGRAELAAERAGLLARPELAAVFGPGSRAEQPICGVVGGRAVVGQIDRLVVTRTRCWSSTQEQPPAAAHGADAQPGRPICGSSPPTAPLLRRSIPAAASGRPCSGPRRRASTRSCRTCSTAMRRHGASTAPLDADGSRNLLSMAPDARERSSGTASECR